MSGLCSAHQGQCPDECPIQYRVTKAELERLTTVLRAIAAAGICGSSGAIAADALKRSGLNGGADGT